MSRFLLLSALLLPSVAAAPPVVDLSGDTARHVVVARGTEEEYQGHPTTLLLPDGRTMFCVWTQGHGGPCGPMKRSDDGGKTWSEVLPVPENWETARNCPALYRLTDPQGATRLFVFAGQGPGGTRQPDNGTMQRSFSLDEGKTWSPMKSVDLECVMPFCTIVPVEGGKKLIGLTNIRRPGETEDPKSNIVAQSESTDGGLTWSPWRVLVDLGDLKPCEPEVVRSPDGKQLLCLLRENVRTEPAHFITSEDEAKTWSAAQALPPGLHGDRHKAVYARDGRLVIAFRDMGRDSPTRTHFVAWVGRYEDIAAGRDGEYKIKLLHSHKGSDCGYPGLELLPDGTFVATTYVKYRPGPEQNSVVSTRFKLNLHLYGHVQGTIDPDSPHTADGAIQGYNYRFCLTNEPGNLRLPGKPPGYDREEYVGYYRLGMNAGALNGKALFNSALLPGENHAYPEAAWPERERIIERHKNFALGLVWFLQNDESVPPAKREGYRRIGLPLDEFPDNDNLPYEMYVREARRIVGRHVFTELDNRPASGLARPPIHPDSVAFTDWAMDSHDCTRDRSPGYAFDGKLILTEESRPAQVPWRSLLPQGVDNLIVPVCLSATHVAWGAVRLEPVWMMTGETAGLAAALAKQQQTTPGRLDPDLLLRALCERRHFVSFFNDLEASANHPAMPAAQYFATKGFFPDYDARLDEPITEEEKAVWEDGFSILRKGHGEPMPLAKAVHAAAANSSPKTGETRGAVLLGFWKELNPR